MIMIIIITSQVRRIVRVVRVPADALETLGPINESAVEFLNDLGPKNHLRLCR